MVEEEPEVREEKGKGDEDGPQQSGRAETGEEEEEELQIAEEYDCLAEEYAQEMCASRWGDDCIADNEEEEEEDTSNDFTSLRKRAR